MCKCAYLRVGVDTGVLARVCVSVRGCVYALHGHGCVSVRHVRVCVRMGIQDTRCTASSWSPCRTVETWRGFCTTGDLADDIFMLLTTWLNGVRTFDDVAEERLG